MGHDRRNKKAPRFFNEWQQTIDALPILIVERSEASVMSTDALIAAAQSGLNDACENYRTAFVEHRGT